MRYPRLIFTAVVGVILVGALASAGTMTLTRDGSLYRVTPGEHGLVLSWTSPGEDPGESLIPQTAEITAASVQLAINEETDTPFILWQQGEGEHATIVLAWNIDGTWFGPEVVAGGDGTAAMNPQFLVHTETAIVTPEDSDYEPFEVCTTFLHLVWWSQSAPDDVGVAMYAGIPLNDEGAPDFGAATVFQLGDLLPYGIGCSGIEDAAQLAHPKLFFDPETGNVDVLATDFANCLIQIVEMVYQVDDWDDLLKRGRHSIIFGRTMVMAIHPDLPLGNADFKMGHDLAVVVYWDGDEAIDYTHVDESGWSEVRTLGLSDELNHEEAVELIRNLTR